MGKNKTWVLVLLFVCWWGGISCQPVLESYPVLENTTILRNKLVKLAESYLYVKEATGKNDGRDVEKFQKSVGLKRGSSWCTSFVAFLHIDLNIPNPESGSSTEWFKNNVVYVRKKPRTTEFKSRPGQVVGFWGDRAGRINHSGLIASENLLHYNTIEGNYSNRVARVIRRKTEVHAISDFVGYREILTAMKGYKK